MFHNESPTPTLSGGDGFRSIVVGCVHLVSGGQKLGGAPWRASVDLHRPLRHSKPPIEGGGGQGLNPRQMNLFRRVSR